jgi:hypothetical protein
MYLAEDLEIVVLCKSNAWFSHKKKEQRQTQG